MRYINPITGLAEDTQTLHLQRLRGLIWCLKHSNFTFERVNGAGAIQQVCRAIRARYFRERQPISGRLLAGLNSLDPPPCRCGRAGTRIIGGRTFCTKCGPPPAAKRAHAYIARVHDTNSADISAKRVQADTRDLGRKLGSASVSARIQNMTRLARDRSVRY